MSAAVDVREEASVAEVARLVLAVPVARRIVDLGAGIALLALALQEGAADEVRILGRAKLAPRAAACPARTSMHSSCDLSRPMGGRRELSNCVPVESTKGTDGDSQTQTQTEAHMATMPGKRSSQHIFVFIAVRKLMERNTPKTEKLRHQ